MWPRCVTWAQNLCQKIYGIFLDTALTLIYWKINSNTFIPVEGRHFAFMILCFHLHDVSISCAIIKIDKDIFILKINDADSIKYWHIYQFHQQSAVAADWLARCVSMISNDDRGYSRSHSYGIHMVSDWHFLLSEAGPLIPAAYLLLSRKCSNYPLEWRMLFFSVFCQKAAQH